MRSVIIPDRLHTGGIFQEAEGIEESWSAVDKLDWKELAIKSC